MAKYKISFEMTGPDLGAEGYFLTTVVAIPVGAVIEKIVEPFVPDWYGFYRTDDSLVMAVRVTSEIMLRTLSDQHYPSTAKRISIHPKDGS
jgi:hypothetical protein